MKTIVSLICIFCYLSWPASRLVESSSAMKRLYEDLFTDYNRLILPVANNKTKVTVTLGLKLGQILDLNLKQQILSTNVWVEQTWHDYKLQWDPDMYGGIDMIHVPAENIWIPDIVLFNNADGNYELTLVAKARLYSNGTVVWKPPTMFRSTCEIDVEHFPFDIQTCYLRFGSWTYAGDELELKHPGNKTKNEIGVDLSQFYKNVEWDIIDVPAYYNENYYECCTEPFPDITFKIVIRRKMLFYLVNLILPVGLMTFMTVSVFYLPADSNEKVTLSISILTSLIVFFLLMLEIIPASSLAVPLFGKYLLFTLVLVSLSACVSVYVLNLHHRAPSVHSMSPRMRRIFLKTLPRILGLDRPDPRERSSLNRFRKKKIAQQMLQQSSTSKMYDLAQPLAASLNLIETLHKSYESNPMTAANSKKRKSFEEDDDEGRYFRKYIDNYIDHMRSMRAKEPPQGPDASATAAPGTRQQSAAMSCNCGAGRQNQQLGRYNCCEHRKCCQNADQPLLRASPNNNNFTNGCCGATNGSNDCGVAGDLMLQMGALGSMAGDASAHGVPMGLQPNRYTGSNMIYSMHDPHATKNHPMLNDDTLDMTFDYDDQQDNNINIVPRAPPTSLSHKVGCQDAEDELPSPPPPPRQLTQLSDTLQSRSGRCSRNQTMNSSEDSPNAGMMVDNSMTDHGHLVDKLINSINMINNASEDMDTTTTSQNEDIDDEDFAQKPFIDFSGRNPIPGAGCNYPTPETSSRPNLLAEPLRQPSTSYNVGQDQSQIRHRLTCHLTGADDEDSIQMPQSKCTCNHMNDLDSNSNQRSIPLCNGLRQPSDLLLSLRLSYDQMPDHIRAAIRSILFIADTIKNEDDENSAIEDWESLSMVVDRVFLWIFLLMCTFGSIIILAMAPSLYDARESIDDKLRIDVPPSNCSASVNAH